MIFDITKSIFDNTKSVFWYHKFDFVIYKNHNDFCDIKKSIVWYYKIEYVLSQIRSFDTTKSFFDITKLILRYHKITNYLLMSQNRICDIKRLEFVISHNRGLIFIAKRRLIIFGCMSTDVTVCSNFYRISATNIASVSTVWRPLVVLMPSSGIVSRIILTNMLVCCGRCWMINSRG